MTYELKILMKILLSASLFLNKKSGGMALLDSSHVYR
jgi:hypothetical protein